MSERNLKFGSDEGLKFLSTMADPSVEVPLPFSVEEMLKKICSEQSLPMPDIKARRELSLIGEEASLLLLLRVRNLTDYITFTARSLIPLPSQESVNFSGLEKSDSSASVCQKDDAFLDLLSLEEQSCDLNLPSPNMKVSRRQMSLDSSILEKPQRQTHSPHLLVLAELEFKKAFLILSYCGKNKLEDVMTVDTIQRLKNFPMAGFESELWRVLGYNHIEETDRAKNLDWDSEGTFMYHCHVDSNGSYMFKGPYLQKGKTHLQRVLGDDNVLLVKFAEGVLAGNSSAVTPDRLSAGYHKVAKEGIFVGLRCYRFYVFKDGGKAEKKKSPTSSPVKCYFVCMGSTAPSDEKKPPCILFNKSISEARSIFMHVHKISSIAKYMARFSLILSKSVKLEIDLASVHIQRIEDKPCLDEHGRVVYNEDGEARIHSDGTGFISEDLALKCPRNISRGNYLSHRDLERILSRIALEEQSSEFESSKSHIGEPPCLIQVRLFNNGCAVKGTLLINKKLPPRTIQIRPSMIKVEMDPDLSDTQSANSLEIVSTSNQPRKTSYLSRYLIALLTYGGVPKDYFMELVVNALEIAQNAHYDKRAALTVALKYGDMDDYLVPRMILCGIPLDEPYLHHRLSVLLREERKGLMGGKLPVSECYYLMGTSDPTGMLNIDEVCIILEDGQISGKVLVYKHPGLHFGDIHVLKATYVKELENVVGNAKYAIFFPTKGPRSLADEIANSDFDGDMYWVSRNPQLLECFRPSKPWTQTYSAKSVLPRKPSQFSSEELENELFQQFLTTRFNPSSTMGIAADSWLSFMDRILTLGDDCSKEKECVKEKMLQLIDIYYDALDAPKTGKKVEVPKNLKADRFPHYMDRPNSYNSKSVLGQIYDKVESFRTAEVQPKEEWKLPCFSGGVPDGCMQLWRKLFEQYRVEMTHALQLGDDLREASASQVILKYKQILYNASEFNESTRKREDVFNEALAIYNISYDYAKSLGTSRCSFAWKVAGRALCELHIAKQEDDPIVCSKSVISEIIN